LSSLGVSELVERLVAVVEIAVEASGEALFKTI
jgi:hypothetical protein